MSGPSAGEADWPVALRVQLTPVWPLRMPSLTGADGLVRRRGGVLERLVHHRAEAVLTRCAQRDGGDVVIGAWAHSEQAARWGIERMRFALGVDDDLLDFHRRFARDPWLGRAIRADRGLRIARRPEPFEALTWAVCEQLIEYERAAAIQRRLTAALGRRCQRSGLRDAPTAEAIAGASPALLESCDLSGWRALALIRAAREIARGRVDLYDGDHERAWRRLRSIPGIGSWTLACLAIHGQGRLDQVPAGDLNLLKLVGRARGADPRARATEEQVHEHFAPYAPYGGLAAAYAISGHGSAAVRSPVRRGTRWSSPGRCQAAA